MGIKADDYPDFFRSVFTLTNIRGALVTMPHKVTTMGLVDEISPTAAIAGATNAVLRREDGSLLADQFDGAGFVRGMLRKGFNPSGKRALVVGNGGVGSSIAASLAGLGLPEIGLFDPNAAASEALAQRIGVHYPDVKIVLGSRDPEGYDLIVNASPIGMNDGRSSACRRRPPCSGFVRRRCGAQGRHHPVPAGRQGQGLLDPGR
jgi:shikimate dehydrogenase